MESLFFQLLFDNITWEFVNITDDIIRKYTKKIKIPDDIIQISLNHKNRSL